MEPNRRPLDHWAHTLERAKGASVSSFASGFGILAVL